MLSESIYQEVRFLIYSFALGIIITFVYDNIRVFRRVIRHNTFFVSIEDLFFWIGVSLSVFLLQHWENKGIFRWFSVVGAFLGMIIYKMLLSRFYVKEMTFLFQKILKGLYIVFSFIFTPIYFIEKKVGSFLKKIGFYIRQKTVKQKIRLTSYRKMVKMTLCKHKKRKSRSERRTHGQKNCSS